MGVVAGAEEAGQTPQAPNRTQQSAEQTRPAQQNNSSVSERAQPAAPAQQADVSAPGLTPASPELTPASAEQAQQKPGFGERGRMRRRARFLRKARELAYRDLGGLVFDLHRFAQRNDPLVLAKLAMLRQLDTELRELERALRERRPVTVLREVGIAACPRCAAIHGSDDRFCPGCGLAFDANADRPISTAPMAPQAQAQTQTSSARPASAVPTVSAAPAPGAMTPSGSTSVSAPSIQQPTAPPTAPAQAPAAAPAPAPAPRAAPVPAQAHDDEQTQILRPPTRDE